MRASYRGRSSYRPSYRPTTYRPAYRPSYRTVVHHKTTYVAPRYPSYSTHHVYVYHPVGYYHDYGYYNYAHYGYHYYGHSRPASPLSTLFSICIILCVIGCLIAAGGCEGGSVEEPHPDDGYVVHTTEVQHIPVYGDDYGPPPEGYYPPPPYEDGPRYN